MGGAVGWRQLGLLTPRDSDAVEHVGRPCLHAGQDRAVVGAHQDGVAGDGHTEAEGIVCPAVRRGQLLLQRPGGLAADEDIGRTRLGERRRLLGVWRADDDRVAGDGDVVAELPPRAADGGGEGGLLYPPPSLFVKT